jgi:hypothetical protein
MELHQDTAYSEKINDLSQFIERITAAIATVMLDMIRQVWTEMEYCLQVCDAANGAYTEVY